MGRSKVAGSLATYLHAFILLASLVLVPADPLFKTYENAATMALADQLPDESVDKISMGGEDPTFLHSVLLAKVGLLDGERKSHCQDAPRVSGCGRAFHARGPPSLNV